MRRAALFGFVMAGCFLAGRPRTADAAGAPTRVGVVRIQQVFKEYQYARDMEQKIKEAFKKDETEINDLKNKIKEAKDRIAHDPLIERGKLKWKLLMIDIQRDSAILEDKMDNFKSNTRKAMAEFYRTIYADFRAATEQFGAQQGFDLIITAPDTELSGESEDSDSPVAIQNEILLRTVQYISPTTDVTNAIVQAMNARYQARAKGGR